jgi:membrane protease YdiL (CAAX protease family)
MIKKDSQNSMNSLTLWIALVFGITAVSVAWLWSTGVNPMNDFSPAIIVIGYASSLAALLAMGLTRGWAGIRELLGQILIWRVSIAWYLVALVGPIVLVLLAVLLSMLMGTTVESPWLAMPSAGDIGGMIGPLIAGSLGEELGWRGVGQRLLQKRSNVLIASVTVGLLWATWHNWPAIAPGGQLNGQELFESYVRLISTAVIYGWIYARTGGSLLLVMLAHAGHNIAVNLLPSAILSTDAVPLLIAVLYAAVAVTLVVARPAQFAKQS